MTTLSYNQLEGGRYLKATFDFDFVDVPALYPIQDALFTQADEVARWRTGLRRMIQSMQDDFGYMVKALDGGSVWYPLGDGPDRNPYAAARRIEEAERHLKLWCAAVTKLQKEHTGQEAA